MTSSHDSRLRRLADAVDIYLSNRERSPADADAVLEQHGELRDLLEPMLKAEARGEPTERARDRLGEFHLVREIGRGGMGVVYEAVEDGLSRRVALKVLPAHVTLSPRAVERFRREAAVLAKLQHPSIVPIYRVGELDGTHYFAMELVEGRSLGDHIAELQMQRAAPGEGATSSALSLGLSGSSYVAEVVEVVAQAAEALAAAHAQGVLHRDVKPHNLLLGRDGRVRVVDFGLAKDLDRASISRSGEVAGTPHYMSPEQAQGHRDLDGRTDVFSLGVVLYELLALQLPFDGENAPAVLQAIIHREPPQLRGERVPRDLEIVCRKALEKLPRDRYASCAEFAADLRRVGRLEPIEARAPGSLSRVIKLIRRHQAASLATVLAVLVFVVGPLVFWSVMRHKDAETARQRVIAQDNFARARRMVEQQLARVDQLAKQPGMETLHRQMVEDAAQSFREFLQQDLTDPALAGQALDAQILVARVQQQLGDLPAARRNIDEAIARAEAAAGGEATPQRVHLALLEALRASAQIAEGAGDVARASADLTSAVTRGEALAPRAPADLRDEFAIALARTHGAWGAAAVQRGEGVKDAGAHLDAASRYWQGLEGKALPLAIAGDELDHQRVRGQFLMMVGNYTIADGVLVGARTRAMALVAANRGDPLARALLAQICGALGAARSMHGPRLEADPFFVQAVEEHEALLRDFPRNQSYRYLLHKTLVHYADHLKSSQRRAEALPIAQRATELIRELCDQDPDNQTLIGSLIDAVAKLGEIGEHEWPEQRVAQHWNDALANARQLAARFPTAARMQTNLGLCLNRVATFHAQHDEWARAGGFYAEAADVQRKVLAAEPAVQSYRSGLLFTLRQLAKCQAGSGDLAGAEARARESLALWPNSSENLGSFAALMMAILADKGQQPEPVDGPATPPTVFDEVAAAVIRAVEMTPAYGVAWRNYDRITPLLVRGDVRRAMDRAAERVRAEKEKK